MHQIWWQKKLVSDAVYFLHHSSKMWMQGAETAKQFDKKLAAQHIAALVESPNDSGFLRLLVLSAYLFCTFGGLDLERWSQYSKCTLASESSGLKDPTILIKLPIESGRWFLSWAPGLRCTTYIQYNVIIIIIIIVIIIVLRFRPLLSIPSKHRVYGRAGRAGEAEANLNNGKTFIHEKCGSCWTPTQLYLR